MDLIDITKENVVDKGFFCKMNAKKEPGYRQKLQWLESRFSEGLRLKLLDLSQGGRGFIEYIPGEYAWRAVKAGNYMVIHCLWVVGKSKERVIHRTDAGQRPAGSATGTVRLRRLQYPSRRDSPEQPARD